MSRVEDIKNAISHLSETDFISFKNWFEEYDAKVWDDKFEDYVQSGSLDKLGIVIKNCPRIFRSLLIKILK